VLEVSGFLDEEGIGRGLGMVIGIGLKDEYNFAGVDLDLDFEVFEPLPSGRFEEEAVVLATWAVLVDALAILGSGA
jgi:hypothetical protein